MPQNLYIDGESVSSIRAKVRNPQVQQVQDEDELPGWGTHRLNNPTIRAIYRRYGSHAYREYLEERSYPQQPKTNVFATQAFLQTGTKLNPGVEVPDLRERAWQESLRRGDTLTIFAQATWQSSPWGFFDKDNIKASDIHNPTARKAYYAGLILGEASDVAAWTLVGHGTGKIIGASPKALKIAGKLGGESKTAQAVRGTLKGAFIGGVVGKALVRREQGYTLPEIAIDIGGDIASFKGFEWGLKKSIEPKLTKMAIQEKVHKQSQHIIYGERGESIGVGLKGTGESGWKPTVYSAKTKSISASAIDKQRGWVIEEGFDVAGGKGRISWIGRVKKFMTSAEFKASGYNPEKPFIVKEVKPGYIMGGGRPVQMSKEILQPRTMLSPTSSISGSARSAIIGAIKSVEWVKLPSLGFGSITLLGELRREKKMRKPKPTFELEVEKQKIKSTQAIGEIQKEKQKSGLTAIMTYKDELIEQIKGGLRYGEEQEQKSPTTPTPTPKPEPPIQVPEEVTKTMPQITPESLETVPLDTTPDLDLALKQKVGTQVTSTMIGKISSPPLKRGKLISKPSRPLVPPFGRWGRGKATGGYSWWGAWTKKLSTFSFKIGDVEKKIKNFNLSFRGFKL